MLTIEQLYEIIKIQQDEIRQLRDDIKYIKEWSDSNDYWLREMIDALTETVDELMDNHCCCEKYREYHGKYIIEKKLAKERQIAELAELEAQKALK